MSPRRRGLTADSSAPIVFLVGRLVDEPALGRVAGSEVCVLHLAVPRDEDRPHPGALAVEALIYGVRARAIAEALVVDSEVRVSGTLDVARWTGGNARGRWGLQLVAHDLRAQPIVAADRRKGGEGLTN